MPGTDRPEQRRANARTAVVWEALRGLLDGEPLDDDAFVRAFNDVAPYTHLGSVRCV